jgi:hypothetical protein
MPKYYDERTGHMELRKKSTEFDMALQADLCRVAVKAAIKKAQELCK